MKRVSFRKTQKSLEVVQQVEQCRNDTIKFGPHKDSRQLVLLPAQSLWQRVRKHFIRSAGTQQQNLTDLLPGGSVKIWQPRNTDPSKYKELAKQYEVMFKAAHKLEQNPDGKKIEKYQARIFSCSVKIDQLKQELKNNKE